MKQHFEFEALGRAISICLVSLFVLSVARPAFATPGPCPATDQFFSAVPVDLNDVSGIVPLGNVNPKGNHVVPSGHFYIYPKMQNGQPDTAMTVKVLSPGTAEIVVIEYDTPSSDYAIHIRPCKDVTLYFLHVKTLSAKVKAALGDILSGGYTLQSIQVKAVSIPITAGDELGTAKTFDVGLQDYRKPVEAFVNQARYAVDFPKLLTTFGYAGNASVEAVTRIIVPQFLYERCAIDYFTPASKAAMEARLSDFSGSPLASGTPKCHRHMQDVPKSAQGNWWLDQTPDHDILFREDHAAALVPWNVDPKVQQFSLNKKVQSLKAEMIAPATDIETAYTFPVREGPQLTNRRFREILDSQIYCYDLVTIRGGNTALKGVFLVQVNDMPGAPRSQLKIEAVSTSRCPALKQPWTFTNPTVYYR